MDFDSMLGQVGSAAQGKLGQAVGGAVDAGLNAIGVNPSLARLAVAGLSPGGLSSSFDVGSVLGDMAGGYISGLLGIDAFGNDWRVKCELGANADYFYRQFGWMSLIDFADIMGPIRNSNGVIFPYNPSITVTHNARYSEQALTHSNYKSYFYEGSDVGSISVAGTFTAQNTEEAKYVMGAIQFFRACTKMFYGASNHAGNPPPVVHLSGYGANYLPRIACVVTSVSHTMPDNVDYISTNPSAPMSIQNMMPTESTLTVNFQPVVSRRKMADNFDLQKYATGGYLGSSSGGGLI